MLECPHCHQHTISRWKDSLVCSNCHTRVKTSKILRSVLIAAPLGLCGVVLAYWEPPPAGWIADIAIVAAALIGAALAFTVPRYREAPIRRK